MQVHFIHYAPEFIETFRRDIVYGQIPAYFPYGLHVSVRPEECRSALEWTEFVKRRIDFPARVPLLETLKYAHSVSLKPNAKIISFIDEGGLLEFTRQYGFIPPSMKAQGQTFYDLISWSKVAKDYDGIYIDPYFPYRPKIEYQGKLILPGQEMIDNPARWYSAWGYAAGFIWDLSVISHFQPIAPEKIEAERNVKQNQSDWKQMTEGVDWK